MRRWVQMMMFLLVFAPALPVRAGDLIDRIVATVNGTAILESDWDEAVRYECLLEQKPLQSLTPADLKATLQRLIDQLLIQQQMQSARYVMLSPEETSLRVQDIQRQAGQNFLGQTESLTWQQALSKYALTQSAFEARAGMQVQTLRFIDVRFRPSIRIDQRSVETYYREKLLPELQRSGVKATPLAEASPKIEELLVQQRVDEMLTAWLRDLRAQSEVQVR